MSCCWAAPSVAAEYLQTTVKDVLLRVTTGELAAHEENGLLFVAVEVSATAAVSTITEPATPAADEPLDFRDARAGVHRLRPAA
jgi:hypothetical protein